MIIVITFVPKGKGETISKELLNKRYAVSISIKEVKTYKIENENIKEYEEEMLIIRTRKELFDRIKDYLSEKNFYNIPEILEIKVSDYNNEFYNILERETSIKKIRNV